jgi:hypothetical protein
MSVLRVYIMLSSQKVLPNSELESLVSPLIYQQRQPKPNPSQHSKKLVLLARGMLMRPRWSQWLWTTRFASGTASEVGTMKRVVLTATMANNNNNRRTTDREGDKGRERDTQEHRERERGGDSQSLASTCWYSYRLYISMTSKRKSDEHRK